jgi:hypothetical protein
MGVPNSWMAVFFEFKTKKKQQRTKMIHSMLEVVFLINIVNGAFVRKELDTTNDWFQHFNVAK